MSEASATLDTTTFENFLSGFSGITLHESVLNLTLTLVGLVGTFGHILSFYKVYYLANIYYSIA